MMWCDDDAPSMRLIIYVHMPSDYNFAPNQNISKYKS